MGHHTRGGHGRRLARTTRIAAVALVCGLAAGPATADKVYKWRDADGNVHYGDKAPPDNRQRQEIILRKPPVVDADVNTRNERTARLLDSFAEERREKQAQRAASTEEAKKRKMACEKARAAQERYRNSAFLYTRDENGERVILDDEAHAAAMASAQADVDKWCK